MPVYNCEKFLHQSIGSLLAQTYGDIELVITDNLSTDGSGEICREFAAKDKRVRYYRNDRNLGGPGNFRRVFSLCTGEYHKWSTADDYWDPTMVEKCVAVLDREPKVVVAYPKTTLIKETGEFIEDYNDNFDLHEESPAARFIRILDTPTLCHVHLGVIRRAILARTALIGDELSSDIRFLAELSLYGEFSVVPEQLFFRRFHETSSSWKRNDMDHQRAYYDPERRAGFEMHTWRRYMHLIYAVTRSPIESREKFKLYRYLFRKATHQRGVLFRELKGHTIRPEHGWF
ncbi:MAG: glycosyltransferase family 2 protein [Deltaproteobacteria bacterium]|nr:glycosyltransferase family 2 protein [Deltaproteobacteria bacterium]